MKKLKSQQRSLGPTVSALLKKQLFSQAEMAAAVGMSPSQICNFLNGKTDIRASLFVEILTVLGIDLIKLVRMEAGVDSADIKDVPRQLSLLPRLEKDTLKEFLKVYQERIKGDSLSA
jgi:transcriptional regulator with XRE-family HTH domain